jgi:tetratricopeptide (TPR) repeat protein
MKKPGFTLAWFILISFAFSGKGFADTVVLKSGKRIEGTITEKTKDYIKIEHYGTPLYYEQKYISSIEEGRPSDTLSFFKAGLALAKDGDFPGAKEEFNKGLELEPDNENLLGAQAVIMDLDKGIIPREYCLNLFSGYYYMFNEDYRQAAEYFQKALQSNVYDADICYNLASAYYSLKEYNLAIEYLKRVLELRLDDAEACNLLAEAYLKVGEPSKAEAYFAIANKLSENAQNRSRAPGKSQ